MNSALAFTDRENNQVVASQTGIARNEGVLASCSVAAVAAFCHGGNFQVHGREERRRQVSELSLPDRFDRLQGYGCCAEGRVVAAGVRAADRDSATRYG